MILKFAINVIIMFHYHMEMSSMRQFVHLTTSTHE